MLDLESAIKHCNEIADYDCYNDNQMKCAEEHRQLAEWLRDYQKLLTGKSSKFELLKDGTLIIESDIDLMTVNRILLSQRDTVWGVLFYPDEDNARNSDLINNYDTISRQGAIEAIASKDETDGTEKVFTGRQVNKILSELPPSKPKKYARTINDILELFEPYLTTDDILECIEMLKGELDEGNVLS